MMRLRKWSSLNKAEKLGRKNALKATFFVFSIMCMPFVGLFVATIWTLGFSVAISGISIFLLPIVIMFFISILLYVSKRKQCINLAYDKLTKDYSKKLAEEMLVRGKPTKVKLLKTRDGHYEDFLLKDLPGRVDYYAVLKENHNIIVIYPKFSDENEKDFFDDISNERRNSFDFIEMEEFSSFCEVVDN